MPFQVPSLCVSAVIVIDRNDRVVHSEYDQMREPTYTQALDTARAAARR